MTIKTQLSKWFGGGHGHVIRFKDSDVLMFRWNGKSDGYARYIAHVKRYSRNSQEYPSLAALLRAVESEHAEVAA